MNKLNNIFDDLSIQNLHFPLNLATVASQMQTAKTELSSHPENQLIYGENIHYDYQHSDNSSELEANSNRVAYTVIDIETSTQTIGHHNTQSLFTGRGNDTIIGLGNASVTGNFRAIAKGESNSIDNATADSTARAVFKATVAATGVKNSRGIATGAGRDTILGLSNVQSAVSTIAEATAADLSLAKANSESTVLVDVLAIGIDNQGAISMGQGQDLLVGIANTSTETTAEAVAIANAFDLNLSSEVIHALDSATAESDALTTADSLIATLGIANAGKVFLGYGNDVVLGVANSQTSSDANSDAQTASSANQIALATANASAKAVTVDDTVGIVNQGLIVTGAGDDRVIGLAFGDRPQAIAKATAEANGTTIDTGANTNTRSLSDTSGAIAIGIDNSGGIIRTGIGRDSVIGYGSNVGITGGRINTGLSNDKVLGYGGLVGVSEATVSLGRGDDYFQAAIGDVDPITGSVNLAADQADAIRDAKIFGGDGHDTFEIGGFGGTVTINGGRDFDTLRLSGDIDNYGISVTGSDRSSLTIENGGSILTVVNVEAIYLGDSEQYSVSDFA